MKTPIMKYVLIAIAAIVFPALIFFCIRGYSNAINSLPPKIIVSNKIEAIQKTHGRRYVEVLGTGSMFPYIARAQAGEDPTKTIVAIAVFDSKKTYKDIRVGDLVNYRMPQQTKFNSILHQAVEKDSAGWIMSGIGNSYSENLLRVTSDNFIGVTEQVYVWPPYDK